MANVNLGADVPQLSNSIATPVQLDAVLRGWQTLDFGGHAWLAGLTGAPLAAVLLKMVVCCADNGTSEKTLYPLLLTHDDVAGIPEGEQVTMDQLMESALATCTVRQFAAFYAPLYWNWAISNRSPPAFWAKKGFLYDDRFAAFDFFFALLSPASIGGKEKDLVREPTEAEIAASQTNSRVCIYRSIVQRKQGFHSSMVEITNGRSLGTNTSLGLLPPAENQRP